MISLALDCTLPGYKDRTYVRRDSSPQAIVELTEAFVNELHRIKEEMQQLLPAYLKDARMRLEATLREAKFGPEKTKLYKWLSEIKKYWKLNIFGFNSGKFNVY